MFRFLLVALIFLGAHNSYALSVCGTRDDLYSNSGCVYTSHSADHSFGSVDVKIYKGENSREDINRLFYLVGPFSVFDDTVALSIDSWRSSFSPSLLKKLDELDVDIVYFDYGRNPLQTVQQKAEALEKAILHIRSMQGANPSKSILLGQSLGGVIGRYALSTIESDGLDHNVEYFVTHDSPHLGAHVPISIQRTQTFVEDAFEAAENDNEDTFAEVFNWLENGFDIVPNELVEAVDFIIDGAVGFDLELLQGLDDGISSADREIEEGVVLLRESREEVELGVGSTLSSDTSKQLLIRHSEASFESHHLRNSLLAELADLGLPKQTKLNVAIANGSLNGTSLVSQFGADVNYYDVDTGTRGDNRLRIRAPIYGLDDNYFYWGEYPCDTNNLTSQDSARCREEGPWPVSNPGSWSQEYFYGSFIYRDASRTVFGDGTDEYDRTEKEYIGSAKWIGMNRRYSPIPNAIHNAVNIDQVSDISPCSTIDILSFKSRFDDNLTGYWEDANRLTLNTGAHFICFIPTVSALAITNKKPGQPVTAADSPFDVVLGNNENESHIALNLDIVQEIESYADDTYERNIGWLIPIINSLILSGN